MERDKTNLNIYDIRDILREDQSLFDKTIQKLEQRTFLIGLDTAQPRHLPNKTNYDSRRAKALP